MQDTTIRPTDSPEMARAIRRMESAGLRGDEARRHAALDLAVRATMATTYLEGDPQ
jgi:hypothetical protein